MLKMAVFAPMDEREREHCDDREAPRTCELA
jgi:hypothetical protein